MPDNQLLSQAEAAELLRAAFGDSRRYWTSRLQNERRDDRQSTVKSPIPWRKQDGRIVYARQALDVWVASELARRLARGLTPINRAGEVLEAFGSDGREPATGRRLEYHLTAQFDEGRREHFAQLMITYPLLVFRLNRTQVKALASEFNDLAQHMDRWTLEGHVGHSVGDKTS